MVPLLTSPDVHENRTDESDPQQKPALWQNRRLPWKVSTVRVQGRSASDARIASVTVSGMVAPMRE